MANVLKGDRPPLTRADIIQTIRARLSLSAREAGRVLEAVLDCIVETMEDGRQVTIPGLGRFGMRDTPSRPGRNPKTGVYAEVPGRRKPYFSVSRVFRERLLRSLSPPTATSDTPREASPSAEASEPSPSALSAALAPVEAPSPKPPEASGAGRPPGSRSSGPPKGRKGPEPL
ncbi:MAG: HU family DNA-binding protein [Deltaproteobacteria bacterium]|jgi:DNA-binding protein HU-beta|nr:HU family DNA-binding protein [Deltaproteobacteria bacterium]